jgi:DNA sulfur modification protein DndD
MQLIKLTIKNFMPYKGETQLVFPNDSTKNTLIVTGDNMRGKTSLLNSIRWALYGNAIDRHSKTIPLQKLINIEAAREGDWEMESNLEFSVNNDVYNLTRKAKKHGLVSTPNSPDDFKVEVYLSINSNLQMGDRVEEIINGVLPEEISRFFLFDGELLQEYEELLIEGSDQGKKIKMAIEQAMGVPYISYASSDLTKAKSEFNSEVTKIAAKEIGLNATVKRIEGLNERKKSGEENLNSLKQGLDENKDKLDQLETQIDELDKLSIFAANLSSAEKNLKQKNDELKEKEKEQKKLLSDFWRDLIKNKLLKEKDKLASEEKLIFDKMQKKAELAVEIVQLNRYLSENKCPTCQQPKVINDEGAKKEELSRKESQLISLGLDDDAYTLIKTKLKKIDAVLSKTVQGQYAQLRKDCAEINIQINKLDREIETNKDNLNGHDHNEIINKRKERDWFVKEQERIKGKIKEAETEISKIDAEISVENTKIKNDSSQKGTSLSKKVELLENLIKVFDNSKSRLRDKFKCEVEKNATQTFLKLSTQDAYQGLAINENYGLSIIDSQGQNVPLRSAGAEQVVALSLIDGLSKARRSRGPIVMDTPFGRLDTKHRKNILKFLPDSANQLVLFVHDGEIRGDEDLMPINSRISARYKIVEVNQFHSRLERV